MAKKPSNEQWVRLEDFTPEKHHSYVYLMDCGDRCKIGMSRDPRKRVRDLRNTIGVDIDGSYVLIGRYNAREVESMLHKAMAGKRLSAGEWFNVQSSSVLSLSISITDYPFDVDEWLAQQKDRIEKGSAMIQEIIGRGHYGGLDPSVADAIAAWAASAYAVGLVTGMAVKNRSGDVAGALAFVESEPVKNLVVKFTEDAFPLYQEQVADWHAENYHIKPN